MVRPRNPILTSIPILREIFSILDRKGISANETCRRSGININVLRAYRAGTNAPGTYALMELAKVAGYRLCLTSITREMPKETFTKESGSTNG